MKSDFKQGDNAPPTPGRPDPLVPALQQQLAAQEKKRRNQSLMRGVFGFAGVAFIAIFIGIDWLARQPQAPEPAPTVAQQAAPPAAVSVPTPVAVVTPEPAPAPELKVAEPSQPPPTIPESEELALITPTEAELMAGEPEMILTGADAERDSAKDRDSALIKRAITGKAWDAYRTLLGRSIVAALPKLGQGRGSSRFDPVWNAPVLYQALLRWKTLGCFSEAEITALVKDSYSGGLITWLLGNNPAMEELLLTIDPKDDSGKVLGFLNDTWAMNTTTYEKYFPLALACAVVFDRPMSIPHVVGKGKYTPDSATQVAPMERYQWYLTKNEAGKLAAPVDRSDARDLVWVVCAPVCTSELEWANDKLHLHRKKWGNAYSMIEYLMERAVDGLNPYKEYSFAEILKEGGICGDQSYFCVNTARAQGIPAMTISGETNSGGHAWAGLKVTANDWDTDVGRIGGAAKGQAANPQTGGSITEQEIQLWNDRHHQSRLTTLSVWRHLWLANFFAASNQPQDQATAVLLANTLGRSFVETWHARYAVLERQTQFVGEPAKPENLTDWRDFVSGMRREFKNNPRMAALAAKAESEFIFPYAPEGEAKLALLRERRRIDRNAGEQADLIADSLKREAALIAKRGGEDAKRDISRLYSSALRDYGGNITGFKLMAEDYFGYLKDDPELARKAARDIELAFKRVVETRSKDWFRATTESSIYQMICGYYRSAGDTARADQLEKRYELLLRRAKRSAL